MARAGSWSVRFGRWSAARTVAAEQPQRWRSAAPALPANPAALGPDQRTAYGPAQEWQILREQQQAQRQHPDTQYWQEAEQPGEYQHQAERNAQPRRTGGAQPDQGAM